MGFSLGSIGKSIGKVFGGGGGGGGFPGGVFDVFNNERSMDFSSDEAAINREWQEKFYKHKHQWEVEDLRAAGLNPILSANSGASVPGGAAAQAPYLQNPFSTAMQVKSAAALIEKNKNEAEESKSRKELTDLNKQYAKQNIEINSAEVVKANQELFKAKRTFEKVDKDPAIQDILAVADTMPTGLRGIVRAIIGSASSVAEGFNKSVDKVKSWKDEKIRQIQNNAFDKYYKARGKPHPQDFREKTMLKYLRE